MNKNYSKNARLDFEKLPISLLAITLMLYQPIPLFGQTIHGSEIASPRTHIYRSYPTHSTTIKEAIKNEEIAHESTPNPSKDLPQLSEEMVTKIKKMPYNDDLFKMAFQTLVYNSHIKDAYQLALIAVAKRPNDMAWHRNLAQVAIWVGDYGRGMKEWLYIVERTNDIKTIKYVISISKTLSYDQVLVYTLDKYLAQFPKDTNAYLELAQALNRLGLPNQALLTLEKINSSSPTRTGYELIATIYTDMGQWDNALKSWQKMDKVYGVSIKSVMAQAVIYYTEGHIVQAINILKQGIPAAKTDEHEFWQTLADLAWIVNDNRLIVLGYSHNLNDFSNLDRVIALQMTTDPEKALYNSIRGWNQFHSTSFFFPILYLGQQLKQWQLINDVLMSLTERQLKEIEKDQLFWEIQASLYANFGSEESKRKVLIQGIMLHPKMLQLQNDLLWLVISNGESLWIKTLMNNIYAENMMNHQELWHVFAEGFNVLDQYYPAIQMYQDHLVDNVQDDQILIDYAALLEKARLYQQAYDMRQSIWQRAALKLSSGSLLNKEMLRSLSQLSPYFVSGTNQVQILTALMQRDFNREDINVLLNWIVPRNYYYLMVYFKSNYYQNRLPDWAGINLALIENNLPALQAIMEHRDREWPRADRINAAVRLENIPLAVDFAFKELTERPMANEIHSEFTLYALDLANHVSVAQEYEQFIDLIGARTRFESKFRLTNSLRIIPYMSYWSTGSNKHTLLVNVPAYDFQSKIGLEQTIHRGKVLYSLGYRKALSGFVPASIDFNYKLASKWTANIKLGYNQENFLDSFLRIGGVQDQINLNLIFNMTQSDYLSFEIQGLNYYSQNRHYLADGYNLFGLLKHKIWLSYPDYAISLFAHSYQFNRNGSFGGNITSLFPTLPPDQLANPSLVASARASDYLQIIPNSYNEAGLIFSFGDTIQQYSHSWRPYLWASLFYNTLTRLSHDIKGGINGTVFGRDSLQLYLEYGSAPTVATAVNYMIGARYMLYF